MSLFRWICLSAPASSDATSLPDRLDGLAQLIDGADRTQLLQLASELGQVCPTPRNVKFAESTGKNEGSLLEKLLFKVRFYDPPLQGAADNRGNG
jgi:hypothetical protein